MAWRRCFSFSLCLVTLSCLVGVVTEQLVFDEERSRVCKGVDALFASGNVSRDRECSSDGPSCLTFECEFEIAKLVPLEIELEIVPCASTRRDGRAVSVVHIRIYDDQDTLVLDAPAVEENSTFVTEHINGTVIIKENITVIQRQEGIVFGIVLLILPPSGVTTSVTLYDPISIRIACEPPPSSASPPPSSASPPPSSASPPPAPRPPASSPPPPTSPPPTVSSESLTVGLAAGVPTVVVLIVIIVVMWLILMVVCIVWRRSKRRSGQSNLRYRYNQEETSKDASKRYTDLRVPSHPMFHHRLPVPPDEKEEEEEETYDEINIMRPAYGVTSIEWNYVQYNTSRSKKDEAWVYPRNKLTYLKDISQGQYAKIMLMEAQNIANVEGTMPVIVKALCSSEKLHQQSFDKERQLRKTYHHQSIVSLLGVCTDTVGLPMMVFELMDYGDLLSFVKAHGPTKFRQAVLDYDDFYKFASDISSALEYLSENGLVHGGVAAENCLVGRNLMVKLTGFSSVATATQEAAVEEEEETYYFTLVAEDGPSNTSAAQSAVSDAAPAKKVQLESEGLLRWKAPETVVYGKSTTKSDVWSFGVLLWEMATYGSVPHADLSTNDVLQNAMQETLKLTLPTHCPEDYFKVIASCQRSKPVDRPSFKELFGLLSVKADKTISGGESCLYEL